MAEEIEKLKKQIEEERIQFKKQLEQKDKTVEALVNSRMQAQQNSSSTTNAQNFEIKDDDGIIKENCKFSEWNIPPKGTVQLDSLVNQIGKGEYKDEKTLQKELFSIFRILNKGKKIQIFDGTSEMMCSSKPKKFCDLAIRDIHFPYEPYWIYIIGDIKLNKSLNSPQYKGQVISYMEFVVENSNHHFTNRPMFGFLIKKEIIKFFRYTLSIDGRKNFEITKDYTLMTGIQYLYDLMSYVESIITKIPISLNIPKTSTAEYFSGATSDVFIVDKSKVFKIFHEKSDCENEASMLQRLGGITGIPSITKIRKQDSYIEISPRGLPIGSSTTDSFYSKLVDIIESVHKKNAIHRDIRPSNILVYEEKPLLIDFGFAVNIGYHCTYQGSKSTASNRICQFLKNNDRNSRFTFHESDDLESLVKTFVLQKEKFASQYIKGISSESFQLFETAWNSIKLRFPCYDKLFEYAAIKDYSKLKEEFSKHSTLSTTTTYTSTTYNQYINYFYQYTFLKNKNKQGVIKKKKFK